MLTSQIRAALESPIQGGVVRFIIIFVVDSALKGTQREKTIKLFEKIEECQEKIMFGIQTIEAFAPEETILTKINGDYRQFEDRVKTVRHYIDTN